MIPARVGGSRNGLLDRVCRGAVRDVEKVLPTEIMSIVGNECAGGMGQSAPDSAAFWSHGLPRWWRGLMSLTELARVITRERVGYRSWKKRLLGSTNRLATCVLNFSKP